MHEKHGDFMHIYMHTFCILVGTRSGGGGVAVIDSWIPMVHQSICMTAIPNTICCRRVGRHAVSLGPAISPAFWDFRLNN